LDRLFVISPFVDDKFISELALWNAPMELVSRPECLGELAEASIATFRKVWVLDVTAEPEATDTTPELSDVDDAASVEEDAPEQPVSADIPLVRLHAKLYVADAGWNSHLWTGSANATLAGFERNVEFLVELRGKRSRCGVDAFLG